METFPMKGKTLLIYYLEFGEVILYFSNVNSLEEMSMSLKPKLAHTSRVAIQQ